MIGLVLALAVAARAEDAAVAPLSDDEAVAIGARTLGMDPKFVGGVRAGLQKLYARDYKGARDAFAALDQQFPGEGLVPVCDALVWQALMLENFDLRYDKQYGLAAGRARRELDAALAKPGAEGWERFLMAGVAGMDAMHAARKEQYVQALQYALEAMHDVGKAEEAAPDFPDLVLAHGVHNYWRTVVTRESKLLPDFGDHRAEGIAQMQSVETYGVFLGPPASLSLAFAYDEDEDTTSALAASQRVMDAYPNNVINDLEYGELQMAARKYTSAVTTFQGVLKVDPDNRRTHYLQSVAYYRAGKTDDAVSELQKYLAFQDIERWQRSTALYRLGNCYAKQKKTDEAVKQWKAAVALDGNPGAKAKLAAVKK